MFKPYQPTEIEPRWQARWESSGLYRAAQGDTRPKYYCLDFFPYPSGEGLHVGHCRNYVPTDVVSRYKRMRGYNVLHPMGWDAFGEPAEQYAVAHGVHPRITTDRNTANFRRQMTIIGKSIDWEREIDSSHPAYYRWTQWFFLMLYRRGLAYRDTNWQWWCPTCQTTLSSHEIMDGVCWRGHSGVTRRQVPAWYFRITAYADELITGLDEIDWPEPVKAMQRNWIGRSEGCEIVFYSQAGDALPVFTTRPDTVFGVTFFVLAPEHPLVAKLTTHQQRAAVEAYIADALRQSELDRSSESRPKTGVFTGAYATNPLSGDQVPVWVGDYVLGSYGAGAVMGVPAHDQRDFEFAHQYALPIRPVIAPDAVAGSGTEMTEAYPGDGVLVNSGPYNGLPNRQAAPRIAADLAKQGRGGPKVQYRMRDWLISRQRYWGTPIPIVYCPGCGEQPVPEVELPVLLPEMTNFQPDGSGRSPLARVPEYVNTQCPRCGGPAQRETDTMGGFACSSWYFLRFTSPGFHQGPFDPEAVRYWMPVDLYVGGTEHAVLHLLYSRFWVKVMADEGLVPFREPFQKLMNQGQLMGPDGHRMAKSRGNVITPDAMVETYGADALRVYSMFMAPFDQEITWSMKGISGARRFLNRTWNLVGETWAASAAASSQDPALERALHQTIRAVTERIETFRFNTMVSALMEFVNTLAERQRTGHWHTATYHQALETLLVLMAPAAPYFTEELWSLTGHEASVHQQPWPTWQEACLQDRQAEVAVQVNGRLRDVLVVPAAASQAEVHAKALESARVQQHLAGQTLVKVIYVPGRILNIVVRPGK
ncbi:MAG TPA: leucine--tRNA ligase [Anaerolineales bacterium]|nr:leucine--tRNA ligase [Anaerolineales bacterium]